jgi:tellurite resistance protein TerC
MEFNLYLWSGFFVFMIISLGFDLGIINKRTGAMSFKRAVAMTVIWITLALVFCFIIHTHSGKQKSLEFLTGYIIELSLSMDNVFIFILIFSYFKVPKIYQHNILFWGVIGAIIMRFIMIVGGVYLSQKFSWVFYIFGVIMIYSGVKIAMMKEDKQSMNPESRNTKNFLSKYFKKYFRVSDKYYDNKFFAIDDNGHRVITPLFVVLLLVEKTDLIFALDSIPAVLSVTQDSFIVFTSNIFAILGLRSLYFMLSNAIERFKYLKFGISIILVFVGIKMIAGETGYHVPIEYSLSIILGILLFSVIFSLIKTSIYNKND